MKRLMTMVLIGAVMLLECATPPPSPTKDDHLKRFSVPFETIWNAGIAACRDLGLRIVLREKEIRMINAESMTCGYGVIILKVDGAMDVVLTIQRIENGRVTEVLAEKSLYDEFWTALEANL